MHDAIAREALVALEYVSVADPLTLDELSTAQAGAIVSLAARVGRARLIDNVILADT